MTDRENLIRSPAAQDVYVGSNPYETNYSTRVDPFEDSQAYEMSNMYGESPSEEEMKRFFTEIDDLKAQIAGFEASTVQVNNMQKQLLDTISPEESDELRRDIDNRMARCSAVGRKLKDRVRHLESISGRDAMKRMHILSVKTAMRDALMEYQRSEVAVNQALKAKVERQYRIVQPDATDDEVRRAIDSDMAGQVFATAILQSNRRGQAVTALEDAKRRQQDIQRISDGLREISELMEELMAEVELQAEAVSQIEHMHDNVHRDVEQGNVQLVKAVKHAWLARRWKRILVIVVIIILIVVLVPVIWWAATHH